jgi:hypothetical protein
MNYLRYGLNYSQCSGTLVIVNVNTNMFTRFSALYEEPALSCTRRRRHSLGNRLKNTSTCLFFSLLPIFPCVNCITTRPCSTLFTICYLFVTDIPIHERYLKNKTKLQTKYISSVIFRRFRKIAKPDYYLRHACLCVRTHGTTRLQLERFIWNFDIFRKSVEKIKVLLKSDKNNAYFTWRPMYMYDNISLNSS